MFHFKMDTKYLFITFILTLFIHNYHCRTVNYQRKSALGHMVPHTSKYDEQKVKVTGDSDDLEVKSEGQSETVHHSVKKMLTENDMQDLWLEDFNKDYLYEMQSDSAVASALLHPGEGVDQCPPPPKEVPRVGCSARRCTSDKKCGIGQKCCFNGCVFTCMSAMPPPPFVDWQNEPPRRLQSGMSWLVPGPDEQEQDEACSTSKLDDDEDALLCPHGFVCYIEFPGNPARGIPNRGHCVQENTNANLKESRQKFKIKTDGASEDGRCVYKGTLRRNGEKFIFHLHPCECHEGNITCKVGE